MQWREIWRLYLTPGDGLLILLLEEFVSKSFSFINDISLCSARHLLYIQKGNYLFRPGNNISYSQCLNVWSKLLKEGKKERNRGRKKERSTLQRSTTNPITFKNEFFGFPLFGNDKLCVFSSINYCRSCILILWYNNSRKIALLSSMSGRILLYERYLTMFWNALLL